MEWSLTAVQDLVSGEVPDRDMLVWEGVRRTYAQVVSRSRRLAAFLVERGIGAHRERADLERWECGQSPVALILHNCPEYIEAMSGCFRARAVPFNVNHYYGPAEVRAVLHMVGAEAVIYHRSMAPMVAAAVGDGSPLLIEIDDAGGGAGIAGSVAYEEAIAAQRDDVRLPTPSPDDLYLVCTGGTTGAPKAVVWRQADIFVSAMGGSEDSTPDSWWRRRPGESGCGSPRHRSCTPPPSGPRSPACTEEARSSCTTIAIGSTQRTSSQPRPANVSISCPSSVTPTPGRWLRHWSGIRWTSRRCSSSEQVGPSRVRRTSRRLLRLLPHVTIRDGYGASETGGMAFGSLSRAGATQGFTPAIGRGGALSRPHSDP